MMQKESVLPTAIELYREGVKLKDEKKFDEAIARLTEAIGADARLAVAYHALTQCYTQSGRHQEAIATAQKVVQLEPDDYFSYVALSRAYQPAGMIPEAEYAMMQGQQAQARAQTAKRNPSG
jgi:tetratricopeptide (TPR) repeat protein